MHKGAVFEFYAFKQLMKECQAFFLGVNKGKLQIGAHNSQGNSGEAGARAYVRAAGVGGYKPLGERVQAVQKMLFYYFGRVGHGGKVDVLVIFY